jgi:hypothetical protein
LAATTVSEKDFNTVDLNMPTFQHLKVLTFRVIAFAPPLSRYFATLKRRLFDVPPNRLFELFTLERIEAKILHC